MLITPQELAQWVLQGQALQESHWLEWKSVADLNQREWQARTAKFILGAANRPAALARAMHDGRAFMLLGLEPGQSAGTAVVDPATVDAGLVRYLGTAGPKYHLNYIALRTTTIAVITVLPTPAGHRPYLSRGSFSGAKPVLQDGRIYVRRTGATQEATATEVDDMLTERISARTAAGSRWPLQPVDAWRDGSRVHVRRERGDEIHLHGPGDHVRGEPHAKIVVHDLDDYTKLMQMARDRPGLPPELPPPIHARIAATFDALLTLADADPARAVQDTWPPLRQLTIEVYHDILGREPHKVIDMTAELAASGQLEPGWVDVAYPLYYWPIVHEDQGLDTTSSVARTYVSLAAALATALLLAVDSRQEAATDP